MNILSLISSIFKPAVSLVDELHTSEEEKLAHKAKTLDSYVDAIELGLAFEANNLKQKAEIIKAEANSKFRIAAVCAAIDYARFSFCSDEQLCHRSVY